MCLYPEVQITRNVETEELLEATTSSHEKSARHPDLDEAAVLYEKVMQGSMSADQVCQSDVITKIGDALQRKTKFLKSSKTVTVWLQYMHMVDILRKYIRAECILATGNCISKLLQKCSLTWPHVDTTTTQNLHGYVCSECLISTISIQMCINIFEKVSMW